MKKSRFNKRNVLRFLFGSFSATAVMFTFQACYGPPPGGYGVPVEGKVLSAATEEPVPNVQIGGNVRSAVTDSAGCFTTMFTHETDSVRLHLSHVEAGEDSGLYEPLDTVLGYEEAVGYPHVFKMKEKSDE